MSKSNKAKGGTFETDMSWELAEAGFWVDNADRQTDIHAARNNVPYLIECKTCKTDYFDAKRVEVNQSDTKLRFEACGNTEFWFAYSVDGVGVFMSREALRKPSNGVPLQTWIDGR